MNACRDGRCLVTRRCHVWVTAGSMYNTYAREDNARLQVLIIVLLSQTLDISLTNMAIPFKSTVKKV